MKRKIYIILWTMGYYLEKSGNKIKELFSRELKIL